MKYLALTLTIISGVAINVNQASATLVPTPHVMNYTVTSATIPTVTSPTATLITSSTATLGATVTSDGGAALTARGTCWGTTAAPTTNCLAEGGTGVTIFTHGRTGLPASTLIYYRGYATNSVGTGYSVDATFSTGAGTSIPTVTLPTATAITSSTATLGATVTSDGGAALTARGTCWGTTAAPTTNCLAEGGTGVTIFTHGRTGLPASTLIYYRGYATNSVGTGYSVDGNFVTSAGATVPTVISPTATSITSSGATLGANVTSDGGSALTARGTCWGTTTDPVTNCSPEGSTATGIFTHARSGMSASTLYYYRGYATNAVGVGYSVSSSFTTSAPSPSVPTVASPTATSITSSGATLGATVTSDGGATLTARGTCFGTSPSPSTNCLAEGGTAVSVFSHARSGMSASTLYYYRGYATNSVGTGYSPDGTFSTSSPSNSPPNAPVITGPTTFGAGTTQQFTFTATDPDSDTIRYGVDWDMDGTADVWLPGLVTYVPSGTPQSASNSWPVAGDYKFQALTQDFPGLNSGWTMYDITVTNVVNGVCDATHFSCIAGTSINNSGTGPWTWQCQGSGGGSTDSCSEGVPQCNDGIDNDSDGYKDTNDPSCHTDCNANIGGTFTPTATNEGKKCIKPVYKEL